MMRLWWMVVALCLEQARAQCLDDVLVMYHVILRTQWSAENFPKQYPLWRPAAQWSVVAGRSHNSSGVLWRIGQAASDPVEQFVATGNADMLIRAKQKTGILFEFFAPPVLQGVGRTHTKFFADAKHSKVSLMCRIVPSPDWFVGVESFNLCHGNNWTDAATVQLRPLDGGTQSGYTFTAPKWTTVPRAPIGPIGSQYPDDPASSFYYPELEELPAIASVTFLKLKEFSLSRHLFRDIEEARLFGGKAAKKKKAKKEIKKVDGMNDVKKELPRSSLTVKEPPSQVTRKAPTALKRKQARPCRVSEWSEWGPCSNECGFGEQTRGRQVRRFGNRPCPPLQESRWCRGAAACQNSSVPHFRWQ